MNEDNDVRISGTLIHLPVCVNLHLNKIRQSKAFVILWNFEMSMTGRIMAMEYID